MTCFTEHQQGSYGINLAPHTSPMHSTNHSNIINNQYNLVCALSTYNARNQSDSFRQNDSHNVREWSRQLARQYGSLSCTTRLATTELEHAATTHFTIKAFRCYRVNEPEIPPAQTHCPLIWTFRRPRRAEMSFVDPLKNCKSLWYIIGIGLFVI